MGLAFVGIMDLAVTFLVHPLALYKPVPPMSRQSHLLFKELLRAINLPNSFCKRFFPPDLFYQHFAHLEALIHKLGSRVVNPDAIPTYLVDPKRFVF
jgi:hypothetical protein